MKSAIHLTLFLAGTIALCESTAADDIENANRTREEKTVHLFTGLEHRVQKMLVMQTAINDRTSKLHKVIQATPDKKPRPADLQGLRQLAVKQMAAIEEAARAIALLEADNSAVAFTEVFQELRKEMVGLHRRLKSGDAGPDTQAIEQDISETLKEMLSALTRG